MISYVQLLRDLSNLTLNVSSDGAAATSLGCPSAHCKVKVPQFLRDIIGTVCYFDRGLPSTLFFEENFKMPCEHLWMLYFQHVVMQKVPSSTGFILSWGGWFSVFLFTLFHFAQR